ncbi:hypothetical protein L226DRAFT_527793 [Lentinus tigrinus ALCF2SS1-7]|uniref:uncharacterized protein n=1 Tax=Lentinus tigrinus ALCF2SS1-7 TaxID=1328758 RepID=UPI0011662FDF|nr:hypothetical protein L226DRAFT_527793 [Lentinus tigrinus ALCF2SS1-7]
MPRSTNERPHRPSSFVVRRSPFVVLPSGSSGTCPPKQARIGTSHTRMRTGLNENRSQDPRAQASDVHGAARVESGSPQAPPASTKRVRASRSLAGNCVVAFAVRCALCMHASALAHVRLGVRVWFGRVNANSNRGWPLYTGSRVLAQRAGAP